MPRRVLNRQNKRDPTFATSLAVPSSVGRERVTCLPRRLRRRQGVRVLLFEIGLLSGNCFCTNPNHRFSSRARLLPCDFPRRKIHVTSDRRLVSERFPRSSQYHPEWVMASVRGGANSLWLTEWLAAALDLQPGMRVLDIGCGPAASSIFLRREFGVQV